MTEPGVQFKHLFHGTAGDMEIGSSILPRAMTGVDTSPAFKDPREDLYEDPKEFTQGWNSPEHAFASSTPELAEWYARKRAETMGGAPRVFRVEPLDHEDVEEDVEGRGSSDQKAYRSRSGFKIMEEINLLEKSKNK